MTAQELPNPKYAPKPYEQMSYPGQRVQIDVKFVPSSCLVNKARGKPPILPRYFCAISWNVFLCPLNVSRQTTGQSSQSVFPLLGKRL